jgi:hypothetical protein
LISLSPPTNGFSHVARDSAGAFAQFDARLLERLYDVRLIFEKW